MLHIFHCRHGEVKGHFAGIRKKAEFLEFLKKYSAN